MLFLKALKKKRKDKQAGQGQSLEKEQIKIIVLQ